MAKATKKRANIEPTLGAVTAHPTRAQVFVILNERVASPNEIANELDLKVGHVSYHVEVLKELGMIELVDMKQRRGAVEHFYKTIKPPVALQKDMEKMPREYLAALTRQSLQLHFTDCTLALEAGTFDSRPNRALVRHPMTVDEEGFADLHALAVEMYERQLEIGAQSANRMAEQGTESIPVVSAHMFFETPPRRIR